MLSFRVYGGGRLLSFVDPTSTCLSRVDTPCRESHPRTLDSREVTSTPRLVAPDPEWVLRSCPGSVHTRPLDLSVGRPFSETPQYTPTTPPFISNIPVAWFYLFTLPSICLSPTPLRKVPCLETSFLEPDTSSVPFVSFCIRVWCSVNK